MLSLPKRPVKPRRSGITSVHDTFLTCSQLESILNDYSEYIDIGKFGVGSAYCTRRLQEKTELYKSFDVHLYFGGTLFEKFYSQNKLEEYFAYLKDYRINMLKISTGTVDIPVEERVSIVD